MLAIQVVAYVQESLKEELGKLKAGNRRLSESQLVEEALVIAMPQLRQRHASFDPPTQESHGKRRRLR
jgi:hypothetical protein